MKCSIHVLFGSRYKVVWDKGQCWDSSQHNLNILFECSWATCTSKCYTSKGYVEVEHIVS